jgi:hypothetical protein
MILEVSAGRLSLGTVGDDVARFIGPCRYSVEVFQFPKQRVGTVAVLKGLQSSAGADHTPQGG